jgi:hypothetical protein
MPLPATPMSVRAVSPLSSKPYPSEAHAEVPMQSWSRISADEKMQRRQKLEDRQQRTREENWEPTNRTERSSFQNQR